MKQVRVIQWLMSHHHATRMMMKLKQKKHAAFGFYYEYEDVGNIWSYAKKTGVPIDMVRIYADYPGSTQGCLLTVYRDILETGEEPEPEVQVWLQRQSLSDKLMAEVLDARRELGKWLNEQPNREVDRRAIATLIAAFDILAG